MSLTPDYIDRLKEIVEDQSEVIEEAYQSGHDRCVKSYVHAFLSLLTMPEEFVQPDVISALPPDSEGYFHYEWSGDEYKIQLWWSSTGRLHMIRQ